MSIVRPVVRSVVRSPVQGALGADNRTDLQKVLAQSPSVLYWRAQNAGTVNRDGTGSTATGTDLVGRIIDLSGNNNHASAPADTSRAQLNATGWVFDGSSDCYVLGSTIPIATNMTTVRAFRRASAGINSVGLMASTGNIAREGFWYDVDNQIYTALGGSQTGGASNTSTGAFVTTTVRNATTQTTYLNGAVYATGAAPAVSGSFANLGSTGTIFNNGELAFQASFPSELSGANRVLIQQIAAATVGAALA